MLFHRTVLATFAAAAIVAGAHAQQRMQLEPPTTPSLDAPLRVPMSHESRHILLEATVNGDGPHLFVLDTGAGAGGRISTALAERLGLPEAGRVRVSDGTGRGGGERPLRRIESLVVGGAEWRDVVMLDSSGIVRSAPDGRPVEGILGFALFHDLLLTVDYPASEIVVAHGALEPGAHTIPFDGARGIPAIDFTLGGVTVHGHIDTGSQGTIIVPAGTIEGVAVAGAPVATGVARSSFNTFLIKEARLEGDGELAGFTLERPVVAFAEIFPQSNLGYGALRHFRMTFDQRTGLVRFEKPGDGPVTFEGRRGTGMLIAPPVEGRPEVASVTPGSPADRAGVRVGDVLLAIAGEAVDASVFGSLRSRMEAAEGLEITLERDGAAFTVTLTSETLLE
ncbi:MAG: aspartyl protease family protein [Phycisphaerales bacterium]